MTAYIVELFGDTGEITVCADQVDVEAGALVFRVDRLPSVVIAPRVWKTCHVASRPPTTATRPAPAEPQPPQLIPPIDVPDPLHPSRRW